MKRRVLSFIIALALCLNLFPVGAFAADAGTDDGFVPTSSGAYGHVWVCAASIGTGMYPYPR